MEYLQKTLQEANLDTGKFNGMYVYVYFWPNHEDTQLLWLNFQKILQSIQLLALNAKNVPLDNYKILSRKDVITLRLKLFLVLLKLL